MITGNARILWAGYLPKSTGGEVPCRVVLGTQQIRRKEKDPFTEEPDVCFEVARRCDSMGGFCYETAPLQDIPIEFFLAMEKKSQV